MVKFAGRIASFARKKSVSLITAGYLLPPFPPVSPRLVFHLTRFMSKYISAVRKQKPRTTMPVTARGQWKGCDGKSIHRRIRSADVLCRHLHGDHTAQVRVGQSILCWLSDRHRRQPPVIWHALKVAAGCHVPVLGHCNRNEQRREESEGQPP